MAYKVIYTVTEKYDPTRKEIGLKVTISGFGKYKGAKIRFAAFPSQEATFSKTGSLTFTAIGRPSNNSLEVIDKKTNKMLQQISAINGNVFTEGGKGQEITI
ncbi:MAG: hypothetical protein ACTSPM_08260, partial [Candidatus Heimdallarchaeota archaeon]